MFKVGDRVRLTASGMAAYVGATAKVKKTDVGFGSGMIEIEWVRDGKDMGQRDGIYHTGSFEILPVAEQQSGPVRTVTRREIVPGAYGIVNISRPAKPMLLPKARDYTPSELREAARIFNEIADVLEEG